MFLNGRSKIWFVTNFFVLKQRSNLRPSALGSRARKKITNDADISFKGVRDPHEADSSETRSPPDCVTQAGPRVFACQRHTLGSLDILVKIAGNKIIGESKL